MVSHPAQLAVSEEKTLLPTEALHQIFEELRTQPTKQGEIGERILQKIKTTDLSSAEEFALAEVYFVSLMGGKAKQAFPKFAKGDGLNARIARQRLMRMKFVIDEKIDDVEKEVYEYRAQLKPVKTDLVHSSSIVGSLARHYQTKGDYEKAVKLIVDGLEMMPLDAPYRAFRLPATHYSSFEKAGKKDVALKLLERAREAMQKNLKENRFTVNNQSKPQTITHRAGTFHRLEGRLLEDVAEDIAAIAFGNTLLIYLETEIEKSKATSIGQK